MSRTQRLAEAILADRQREATAHNIVACFVCGRTFMYRGRRGDLNGAFARCAARIGTTSAMSQLAKRFSTAGVMAGP